MLNSFWTRLRETLPFSIALALLSFPVMARVWFDYLMGGQDWRQADWLINTGAGFVRRGLMGDALIVLSDLTGVSLLVVVQIFQATLFVALVFVIWVICLLHENRRLLLVLSASPAFILIFWAGDIQGTMRKEMFGLLAIALLAMSALIRKPNVTIPVIAVVLFTLGCIGNVMHSFMLPSMVIGLTLLFEEKRISQRAYKTLALSSVAMAVFWMGVAVWFRYVPDMHNLCSPLTERGFGENFCDGALNWIVAGRVDHIAELLKELTPVTLARYFVVATLSLVAVVMTYSIFDERRYLTILLIATYVPMLPLYAVATDWGRWISVSFTSYVLLLMMAHAFGKLTLRKLPPNKLVYPMLAASLLLSPEHGVDWQPGGAVRSIISSAKDFM